MRDRIACVVLGLAAPAHAEHHHDMGPAPVDAAAPAFGASLGLVAASFSTLDYIGNYQGVLPALSWQAARVSLGASLGLYRLEKNGLTTYGPGDALAHAAVQVWANEAFQTGASASVTAPTGDSVGGFGMGHPMVMPAVWGTWVHDQVAVSASVGYGRALVGDMSTHHDHGPWPLVEPMNMAEVTWSTGVEIVLGEGLHGGVHAGGGVPAGAPGHDRIVGAARLAWGSPLFETALELQAGLDGDPFTLRGLVETAVHF